MSLLPTFIRRSWIRALAPRRYVPGRGRQRIKAAIFKPDRLGDLILASGAIQYLREQYGPQNCAVIVADFAVEFAQRLFDGSLIIGVPFAHNNLVRGILPALWKLRPTLGRYEFEKVICFRHQRTMYQELLLGRLATTETFGLKNSTEFMVPADVGAYEVSFTRSGTYPVDVAPNICREIEANRRVLSAVENREVEVEAAMPRIELAPAAEKLADTIIISPFASTEIRTYPLPLMAEVMRLIRQQHDVRFLLCGEGKDAAQLVELRDLAASVGVREVGIHTPPSFIDFAASVAAARGVISVDTSTAHLATAMDKPAAIILGGGQYGHFGPWWRSERQAWFTHAVPCFHCLWNCYHRQPYCITEVAPAMIAKAMIDRLR